VIESLAGTDSVMAKILGLLAHSGTSIGVDERFVFFPCFKASTQGSSQHGSASSQSNILLGSPEKKKAPPPSSSCSSDQGSSADRSWGTVEDRDYINDHYKFSDLTVIAKAVVYVVCSKKPGCVQVNFCFIGEGAVESHRLATEHYIKFQQHAELIDPRLVTVIQRTIVEYFTSCLASWTFYRTIFDFSSTGFGELDASALLDVVRAPNGFSKVCCELALLEPEQLASLLGVKAFSWNEYDNGLNGFEVKSVDVECARRMTDQTLEDNLLLRRGVNLANFMSTKNGKVLRPFRGGGSGGGSTGGGRGGGEESEREGDGDDVVVPDNCADIPNWGRSSAVGVQMRSWTIQCQIQPKRS